MNLQSDIQINDLKKLIYTATRNPKENINRNTLTNNSNYSHSPK